MRIRTQFVLTMLLFGVVLAAISTSVVITNQMVQKATEQEKIAVNIARDAGELIYLANDYVIYQESQQLERWQARFASFSSDVAALQTNSPEHQALVQNMQVNTRRLKEIFDSIVSAVGGRSQEQGRTNDMALIRVSWSRMAVQSQGLSSDASRLSQVLHEQVDQLQKTNTIFVIALIGFFVAYFLVNYLLTQRRALKGLANLQAGTAVIGSGDLDFRIEEKRKDEIGDLSRSFNRMTADLKTVTASKNELEAEIDQRKKVEETLRQRTAELEVSNRELEAFSYSVSHDLRAPLRSMEGFCNALLEDYADKLDAEGKKYLRYIMESSDLMALLIDDMLKLSRVTRSDMSYEIVNLSELAQKIAAELGRAEPHRKVNLNIAPDITADGDRNLLRMALENLMGNAWKFTSKADSPRIEMGIKENDGRRAYFIQDNGVGFDMRYADKLFKPFQRLHKSTDFTGTGIGLATVQRIISRHGGKVWAESEVGEGATFYFTLG